MSDRLREKPEKGTFILPGGYIPQLGNGKCHQVVKLRPLTGVEEEMILQAEATTDGNHDNEEDEEDVNNNIITLTTKILTNCIEAILVRSMR